jgi:hypothetical protein
MEGLNELIEKYKVLEAEWRLPAEKEKIPSLRKIYTGVADTFNIFQKELQTLQSEHKAEIEAIERKAWECSVEMMEHSRVNSEAAEMARPERYKGLASGWKYAAYKLREAFGFPKSETPEKFKK